MKKAVALKGEAAHVVHSDAASMADITALGDLVAERLGSVESTSLRRMGTVEEVAAAALFLAEQATFTANVELAVDGGFAQGLGH